MDHRIAAKFVKYAFGLAVGLFRLIYVYMYVPCRLAHLGQVDLEFKSF